MTHKITVNSTEIEVAFLSTTLSRPVTPFGENGIPMGLIAGQWRASRITIKDAVGVLGLVVSDDPVCTWEYRGPEGQQRRITARVRLKKFSVFTVGLSEAVCDVIEIQNDEIITSPESTPAPATEFPGGLRRS